MAIRDHRPLVMQVCLSQDAAACNSIQGMTTPMSRSRASRATLSSCASLCVLCPAVDYEVQEGDEVSNLPKVACIVIQFLFILVQRLRFLHQADALPDADADSEGPKPGRQRRNEQVQGVYTAQKEVVKEQIGAAML